MTAISQHFTPDFLRRLGEIIDKEADYRETLSALDADAEIGVYRCQYRVYHFGYTLESSLQDPFIEYIHMRIRTTDLRLRCDHYWLPSVQRSEQYDPRLGDRVVAGDILRHVCVFNVIPLEELTMYAFKDDLAALVLEVRLEDNGSEDLQKAAS